MQQVFCNGYLQGEHSLGYVKTLWLSLVNCELFKYLKPEI